MILLAIAATTLSTAEENPSLFLVDGTFQGQWTRIFQVDPATAALVLRADLGSAYTPALGMAAASAKTLYLTGSDTGPTDLCQGDIACQLIRVELDPSSTTPLLVQSIGVITADGVMVPGFTGLTFRNDGRLYGVSQSTGGLYTINRLTAEATLIGTVDIPVHGGDITFDSSDRLWLWANIGAGSGIYQVDPETAHATVFDLQPGLDLAGMAALGHGDTLRGESAGNDRLYEIDTTLGITGVNLRLTLDGANFDHSRGDLDSPFCEGDEACADVNVCTSDVCEPGGCNHPAVPNGNACDDQDACTLVDSCQSGACAGGNPVVCAAPDACHEPGTCDPNSGTCENAPEKPDGTPCDDGNACTQVDTCQAGTCTGAAPAICTASDACHNPGICNPATGICDEGSFKPDGTQCNDGNACTQVDSCQAGACVGTSPVVCSAADDCHIPGSCDQATGVCGTGAEKPNGTQCNDGNACTQVDSCQTGACVGTSPVVCTAADDCHDPGSCDQATGVCGMGAEKPDGTQCSDGNACTQVDSCHSGICYSGPPADVDGDGHVDANCGGNDCVDTNPFVWSGPFEVTNLNVNPGNSAHLMWDSQDALAGPGTSFDLASGTLSGLTLSGFSSSVCLQSAGGNSYTDARPDPAVGEGYWYLTRAKNLCGTGTYGSSARDNSISSCP